MVARVQRQQRLDARRAHRDLGDVCWLRQGTTQTHTRQRSWREVEEAPVEEELFFFIDMRSRTAFACRVEATFDPSALAPTMVPVEELLE